MDVGLDVHGRLAHLRTGIRIVDGHEDDVAAAVALAERRELQHLRPRLGELFEIGLQFGDVVPAVEIEPDLELRVRAGCRRCLARTRLLLRAHGGGEHDERGSQCDASGEKIYVLHGYFRVKVVVAEPPFWATAFSVIVDPGLPLMIQSYD